MKLYYFPTLNGHKVTIALEEMGLEYEVVIVDILKGEQHAPAFRAINPNARIPALVDGEVGVFESGAILQYLGRKSGLFYPRQEALRARIDSWLFWQMASLGPMSGQVNWFERAAQRRTADGSVSDPMETSFAIRRFRKETERLFDILEAALAQRPFVCGDYSLADMCIWPWIEKYPGNGGGLATRPALSRWHEAIAGREAVVRALEVGAQVVATHRAAQGGQA